MQILTSQTFWTAVTAIVASIASLAVIFAWRQLRFNAWLKAQEIFTEKRFVEARGVVLVHYPDPPKQWSKGEKEDAFLVCRKMDELARLKRYLGTRKMLATWDDPLGKCWCVLKPLVLEERHTIKWKTKWDAFEHLGEKAFRRVKRRE